MKLLASSLVGLWGALYLCARVQASTFEVMREAAASYQGPFPCGSWDCNCAYRRQRGCCCVASQAFALEEATFMRMVGLWEQLHAVQADVEALTGNIRIAFTASMALSENCFGSFTTNVPIPYASISLNHGNGYNPALGIFTAPRAGLYVFSFTVYSHVGEPLNRLYHKVQLMKNGVVLVSTWEDNREDVEDSSTQVVVVAMQRGSQVYVELVPGRSLCGNIGENKFSGFLLYPYDE